MPGGAGGPGEPPAPAVRRRAAAALGLRPLTARSRAPRPHFESPHIRFHDSWLEALREYHDEGRHDWLDEDIFEDRDEFGRYCAALNAAVERPGEPDLYLAELYGTPPPGRVGRRLRAADGALVGRRRRVPRPALASGTG